MACRSQWRSASVLNEWDVINLKTAKALGLGLLLGLLNTANEVIEHSANVRYWHKADITRLSSNVRFWG